MTKRITNKAAACPLTQEDNTPNQMFSFGRYPIIGKDGVPLCDIHGRQLEMKEVVIYDREATEINPPRSLLGVRGLADAAIILVCYRYYQYIFSRLQFAWYQPAG